MRIKRVYRGIINKKKKIIYDVNHPNDVVRINISVTILGGLLRIICDHYKRINLEEYECVAVLHDIAVLVL